MSMKQMKSVAIVCGMAVAAVAVSAQIVLADSAVVAREALVKTLTQDQVSKVVMNSNPLAQSAMNKMIGATLGDARVLSQAQGLVGKDVVPTVDSVRAALVQAMSGSATAAQKAKATAFYNQVNQVFASGKISDTAVKTAAFSKDSFSTQVIGKDLNKDVLPASTDLVTEGKIAARNRMKIDPNIDPVLEAKFESALDRKPRLAGTGVKMICEKTGAVLDAEPVNNTFKMYDVAALAPVGQELSAVEAWYERDIGKDPANVSGAIANAQGCNIINLN